MGSVPTAAAAPAKTDAAPALALKEGPQLEDLIVALRASAGNVARASTLLGISRQRAYRLLDENAIDLESFRD